MVGWAGAITQDSLVIQRCERQIDGVTDGGIDQCIDTAMCRVVRPRLKIAQL